ncbi:hypothetical protein [Sansalvadorimonas verongulae]|uniref:hypothetical protein n=1 Tax=Sansalvadorimonas verongulae TaxID=2172824 RepID=UPI001E4403BD|nr:hypothetical protein [Sansalvadorimonas verongulae]
MVEAGKLTDYALGYVKGISYEAIDQLCNSTLPLSLQGWSLVCELRRNLGPNFSPADASPMFKPLASKQLIELLNLLAGYSFDKVAEARALFLRMICRLDQPLGALEAILLRNKADKFRKSTELAVDVIGISYSDLVHPDEWRAIKDVVDAVYPADSSYIKAESVETFPNRKAVLTKYFKAWGHVPRDAIAAFMALMATNDEQLRTLVNDYSRSQDYEGIMDEYLEAINQGEQGTREKINIQPVICYLDKVEVKSIFGRTVSANFPQKPESILFFENRFNASERQAIQLRKINAEEYSKDQLLRLLQASTELILEKVFGKKVNLERMWNRFGESSQLDIKLTQLVILDEIIPTLGRLQVNQGEIGELLNEYRKVKRLNADPSSRSAKYDKRLDKIKTQIKQLIQRNSLKKLILEKNRREIGERSQYFPDSVPFELFQNADDAYCERMLIGEADTEKYPHKFIIRLEAEALSFYHWGREVNYCPVGYEKGKGRFDRDLEKMVSLNMSDKGEHVTGKFGLGFKSSLLISDAPELLSGEMAVKIEGGILPVVHKNRSHLIKRATSVSGNGPLPTLVHLKLRKDVTCDAREILSRFRKNSGLLSVFSRHIRTIDVANEIVQWTPKESSRVKGLFFGHVKLPVKDEVLVAQRIVHYRTSKGQFVFQIDRNGLSSLEERDIPKFWVTNPLQEELEAGFVVEADFQVDIGRSQLAKNNSKNFEVMAELGRELSNLLKQIYEWSVDDWDGFCREWSLDEQLAPVDFWNRTWNVLTGGWTAFKDSKAELFQTLFTTQGGLLAFFSYYPVVPVRWGRKDKQRQKQKRHSHVSLISLKNVRHQADKLLSVVFEELSGLEKLQAYKQQNSLVDDEAGRMLMAVGFGSLSEKTLVSVIDEHTTDKKVTPKSASLLGRVFNEKMNDILQDALTSESQDFRLSLRKYRFQDVTGRYWHPVDQLVLSGDKSDDEESRIYAYAPDHHRLSPSYDKAGQAFFVQCQDGLKPSIENLKAWAEGISSKDHSRQDALLRYLISGFNGRHLGRRLKALGQPRWLLHIDSTVLKKQFSWTASDIYDYKQLMLVSDEEKRKSVADDVKTSRGSFKPVDALNNIYEWWAESCPENLATYEDRLYSQSLPWKLMAEDDVLESHEARKGWLKLLYLGACQTIGRVSEGHHRTAMDWIERKGWWDRMAQEDMQSEDWTGIIDEYLADAQVSESYRVWLQILPMYNFSKNLESYVHMLLSLDRLPQLNDFLKSSESQVWQGTGEYLPALRRSLGIGANFVIRELIRHKVIPDTGAQQHAFVLSEKVRRLINRIGYTVGDSADPYQSEELYKAFFRDLNNDAMATFDFSFDIPFRFLADEPELVEELLGIGEFELDEQE